VGMSGNQMVMFKGGVEEKPVAEKSIQEKTFDEVEEFCKLAISRGVDPTISKPLVLPKYKSTGNDPVGDVVDVNTGEIINNEIRDDVNMYKLSWRYAYTAPKHPHWYIVRAKVDKEEYDKLFDAISRFGTMGWFLKRRRVYYYRGDGYKYWTYTDTPIGSVLINRARVDGKNEWIEEEGEIQVPSFFVRDNTPMDDDDTSEQHCKLFINEYGGSPYRNVIQIPKTKSTANDPLGDIVDLATGKIINAEIKDDVDMAKMEISFAKTMPDIPHYYVVRDKQDAEGIIEYDKLWYALLKYGTMGRWAYYRQVYYYRGDGYKYWTYTNKPENSILINVARLDGRKEQGGKQLIATRNVFKRVGNEWIEETI